MRDEFRKEQASVKQNLENKTITYLLSLWALKDVQMKLWSTTETRAVPVRHGLRAKVKSRVCP